MIVYRLKFDHQLEPRDYGLFSSIEKAEKFLEKSLHIDISNKKEYTNTTIYEDEYYLKKEYVS